jgi:hypothetical protein
MTAVLVKIGSIIEDVLRALKVDPFMGLELEPSSKDIRDFGPAVS